MSILTEKEKKLQSILASYKRVVIGFSGGIDSTLVLKEAINALGKENVLAVVANSELFSDDEYEKAIKLAGELGAQVKGVELDYLADEHVKNNKPNSWYYMKRIFYAKLMGIAEKFGTDTVLDGMIMDDASDFRPGLRARDEAGAVSILQQANIYKDEVRQLSQKLGLKNWNKIPSCSVSSRFPYNTELTSTKLQQVLTAEKYLREQGFMTVRVRVHEDMARIEVPEAEIMNIIAKKTTITAKLNQIGYKYVTVDLQGFVSGRMNQELSEAEKLNILVG
ncbi:ATP-dependent sacrificial sulfur transferase LarE [Lactobacillus sp. UCMA15818]|uniref:ATP-dependent sacrificial sulfur transferase LarE n=1 Tax=Lactobacillus sp. UCMA15818 TaxID=2583394 RepID=UPI0025B0701A|nr:ATP-dependent sacrificial sulfur transferase LarE [Lactobacillus sp. UCMA15818]MDN2454417.1 ATP-dependent sacrificial sulfur transferase LarE [Lactobacillus sp. UCMA15818]